MPQQFEVEFDGSVEIQGNDNETQLKVQGYPNQDQPLQEWEDGAGNQVANITGEGYLQVGDDTGLAAKNAMLEVYRGATSGDAERGLQVSGQVSDAASGVEWSVHEVNLSGTPPSSATALRTKLDVATDTNVASATGIKVEVEGNQKITDAVGLQIADITDGTNSNYAIQTGQGTVRFGDKLELVNFASPPTGNPPAGETWIYTKADGRVYAKIGSTEYDLTTTNILPGSVDTAELADGAVTSSKISANTITAAQIASGAVDTAELAPDAVTNSKIASGAVDTAELAYSAVIAPKIASGAVTPDKINYQFNVLDLTSTSDFTTSSTDWTSVLFRSLTDLEGRFVEVGGFFELDLSSGSTSVRFRLRSTFASNPPVTSYIELPRVGASNLADKYAYSIPRVLIPIPIGANASVTVALEWRVGTIGNTVRMEGSRGQFVLREI